MREAINNAVAKRLDAAEAHVAELAKKVDSVFKLFGPLFERFAVVDTQQTMINARANERTPVAKGGGSARQRRTMRRLTASAPSGASCSERNSTHEQQQGLSGTAGRTSTERQGPVPPDWYEKISRGLDELQRSAEEQRDLVIAMLREPRRQLRQVLAHLNADRLPPTATRH